MSASSPPPDASSAAAPSSPGSAPREAALAALPWLAARPPAGPPPPPEAAGEPVRLDLTEALRDGFLRKVQPGPLGEPVEVTVHRLRLRLPEGADDAARAVGLRFLGVVAAAAQAHRLAAEDADNPRWVPDHGDWVSALAYDDALPPVVTAAVLGHDRTLVRLLDAAEDLLWITGSPEALGRIRHAAVLFEMLAEGVLLSGAEARFRLFIAASRLEVRDARGPLSLAAIGAEARAFTDAWLAYREAQDRGDPVAEDLDLEQISRADFLPPEDLLEASIDDASAAAADDDASGEAADDDDDLADLDEARREQRRLLEEAVRLSGLDPTADGAAGAADEAG